MNIKELPPLELLRELFDYNPSTGCLFWKVRGPGRKVGGRAGSPSIRGYRRVRVLTYGDFKESRIIYALYYNERLSPDLEIDHINGDCSDNRINNLRVVTRTANNQNRAVMKNNTSGCVGVVYNKRRQKWMANIKIAGKRVHLGYFLVFEEAVKARKEAERDYNFLVRETAHDTP